ncbi:MAG: HAD hydrolase family protein [Candidatus Bathyarchaeota archaeon]|nr:MAG: HAD hydrolase family protein [Candidatus Bathyarchaeota archaeon]
MAEPKHLFVTDCEGPISKNDNAFEVAKEFIPQGERLFTQLSRYDDVLAYVLKRGGYDAGNTLKLIVPFLRSYGATDAMIRAYSERNITLMPSAIDTLQYLSAKMPSYIISTSYRHYVEALCSAIRFPFQNTYCTELAFDAISLSEAEETAIKRFGQEICEMPLLEVDITQQMSDFSLEEQQVIARLDSIFGEEIAQMPSSDVVSSIQVMGGRQKATAVRQIITETRSEISDVVYVGDSITDVEALRLVKAGGGLAVSFNGNAFAVEVADLVVLSKDTSVMVALTQAFHNWGRGRLLEIAEDFPTLDPQEYGINRLTKDLRPLIQTSVIRRPNPANVQKIAQESSSFRKSVRGIKIGDLG